MRRTVHRRRFIQGVAAGGAMLAFGRRGLAMGDRVEPAVLSGDPHVAIIDAVKADTLSLVAFEVGMFGWMAIVYFLLMPTHSLDPTPWSSGS
jgi:hypothetical protein